MILAELDQTLAVLQAVFVEYASYFCREVGEVAAVQADSVALGVTVVYAVFAETAYGVEYAAAQGVIGVDEEYETFAPVAFDICVESLVLAFNRAAEGGHVAVGHRARAAAAEPGAREYVGTACAAGYYRSLRSVYGRPGTVSPAGAEFADRPGRGPADA